MKKIKTILFSVAVVCVSLFLCSAGCQNAADSGSSGGGTSPISVTGDAATVIPFITGLNPNSPMLNVMLTGETSIPTGLTTVLKNAQVAGKINLDLSQIQITTIGDNKAFAMCKSLKSVNIPSSVTKILRGAFESCTSLKSVNIPSGVTEIDEDAFVMCESLTSVNIPSSVTSIGASAFFGCTSLASVYVKAISPPSGGNAMFNPSVKIYVPSSSVGAYGVASGWRNYVIKIVAE